MKGDKLSVLKDKKLMGWDGNLKLNFSIKMIGIELIGWHETDFVFLLCWTSWDSSYIFPEISNIIDN